VQDWTPPAYMISHRPPIFRSHQGTPCSPNRCVSSAYNHENVMPSINN
jgi:hypothetical protein